MDRDIILYQQFAQQTTTRQHKLDLMPVTTPGIVVSATVLNLMNVNSYQLCGINFSCEGCVKLFFKTWNPGRIVPVCGFGHCTVPMPLLGLCLPIKSISNVFLISLWQFSGKPHQSKNHIIAIVTTWHPHSYSLLEVINCVHTIGNKLFLHYSVLSELN